MERSDYGPTILRVSVALLFLVAGLGKLMNPSMISGMLEGLGFPLPAVLGWLVILAEVLGGLALLVGWQTRYAVWPPFVVLLVALLTVWLPQIGDPMQWTGILFHVIGLAALVSLFLTGPGAYALDKS